MQMTGKFIICECSDLDRPGFTFSLKNQNMTLGEFVQLLRAAETHIRHCETCCKKYGDLMLLRELKKGDAR